MTWSPKKNGKTKWTTTTAAATVGDSNQINQLFFSHYIYNIDCVSVVGD